MKSSKLENILDYNPSLEDPKTLSPFTYYQPFQSSFDPEFCVPPPKPSIWPPAPPISKMGLGSGAPHASGGLYAPWDVPPRSTPRPSAPPLSELKGSSSGASTSGWGEPEGRSLCNTSWRSPVAPKPSHSANGESQSPRCFPPAAGGLSMYSASANVEGKFGGPGGGISSYRAKGGFPNSARQISADESLGRPSYYPIMLSHSGKNINQNLFRTGHSRPMMCNFCKNNKEVPDIYLDHYLYDPETKVLSCPVLRKHVCEICGGTGDQAHTLQYCPVNRERGLQSKVPVLLRARTITNSTGKIRKN